jgi:hypothetical protein
VTIRYSDAEFGKHVAAAKILGLMSASLSCDSLLIPSIAPGGWFGTPAERQSVRDGPIRLPSEVRCFMSTGGSACSFVVEGSSISPLVSTSQQSSALPNSQMLSRHFRMTPANSTPKRMLPLKDYANSCLDMATTANHGQAGWRTTLMLTRAMMRGLRCQRIPRATTRSAKASGTMSTTTSTSIRRSMASMGGSALPIPRSSRKSERFCLSFEQSITS